MKNTKKSTKNLKQRAKEYAAEMGMSVEDAQICLNAEKFASKIRSELEGKSTKELLAIVWEMTDAELLKAQALIIRVMQERAGITDIQ